MDRLIYTAMTGASQTLEQQGAVSHNMANATSAGFRAELHRLRAVPVQNASLPTRAFVADASVGSDFTPGPMQQTGRQYDMAVQGQGWFAVQRPDGSEAYTRAGSFELSANGVLQTRDGLPVMGEGGPITIPPDNQITVGADGTISAVPMTGARNTSNAVGKLKMVNPPEADLRRGEDGLFRLASGQAAEADPNVRVAAGYLEGSNVNVVEQMVSMISLSRQFELQTRMLTTAQSDDEAGTKILSST